MIKVLFFASLKETLGCDMLEIDDVDKIDSVAKLTEYLAQQGPLWAKVMAENNTLVAVNQTMASRQSTLSCGDEVAFFPPVTGG